MAWNASKDTELEDGFYHVFAGEILFALALGRLPIGCSAVSTTTAATSSHHNSAPQGFFLRRPNENSLF